MPIAAKDSTRRLPQVIPGFIAQSTCMKLLPRPRKDLYHFWGERLQFSLALLSRKLPLGSVGRLLCDELNNLTTDDGSPGATHGERSILCCKKAPKTVEAEAKEQPANQERAYKVRPDGLDASAAHQYGLR